MSWRMLSLLAAIILTLVPSTVVIEGDSFRFKASAAFAYTSFDDIGNIKSAIRYNRRQFIHAPEKLNKTAKTVLEVVLNEMAGSARVGVAGAFQDALHIASTIANRANAAGVTQESVVSVRQEFNGYGIRMRPGAKRDLALAAQALLYVAENGPVHKGTFYATPVCVGNLPRGLVAVAQTLGHIYLVDPEGRSFKTKQGYIRPKPDFAGEYFMSLLRLKATAPAWQMPMANIVVL